MGANIGTKRSQLVEGVDYYLEAGRFVFTATYHLKRGYCCNSGCRHCPYRRETEGNAAEVIQVALPKLPTQR